MNDVSQNKKDSILKSLAIAGFIGIIILIAWLSIQLVNIPPGAFSSLASIAEGLNKSKESSVDGNKVIPLTVTNDTTLLKTGETTKLTWGTTETPGSYTFSYECAEGVAVDIVNENGVQSIACDNNYNIGNTASVSLVIDSEKKRYSDVNYTVSFLGTNDVNPRASGTSSITIVNSEIQTLVPDTGNEGTVDTNPEVEPEEVKPDLATETPVETIPPVKPKPTPAEPVYTQEYIYTIPVSDPNGRTDLSTQFISTGNIVGQNFFAGTINQASNGAIQFEVKNLGSKTSSDWKFTVAMPNGSTYTSATQNPLKPNERAVLTIGFTTTNDSKHTFVVHTEESTDHNAINDGFSQTVVFIK